MNLHSESVLGAQGTLGVAVSLKGVRLGAEYNVAKVNNYAFKLGFGT